MDARDVAGAIIFGGVPAAVVYLLGRFAPGLAIIAALIATPCLFLFIAMAGALSGSSPLYLLIAAGPVIGLAVAIRHA